jgi:hypothetical protein
MRWLRSLLAVPCAIFLATAWEGIVSAGAPLGTGLAPPAASRNTVRPDGSPESPALTNASAASGSSKRPAPATGSRTFSSDDVLLPAYTNYLAALRAAGCPETHLRRIVKSDVNKFFAQRRLREALRLDFEWWKPMPPSRRYLPAFGPFARLEKERVGCIARLLGTNRADEAQIPLPALGLAYHLTGPALGALATDRFSNAVEICRRSEERMREYKAAMAAQEEPLNPAEEARLHEQTRGELNRVLTPEEMEEFLLRNSQNAEPLRRSLEGFKPTRQEFLAIFRALDPLQHRMQLDYGNEGALSDRQRDDYDRQCRRAVQEILPAHRFEAYLDAADADYHHARAEAAKRGLDEAARDRLFELYRVQTARKRKAVLDPDVSWGRRTELLRELAQEEENLIAELARAKGSGK